jgi:hypothetical protein
MTEMTYQETQAFAAKERQRLEQEKQWQQQQQQAVQQHVADVNEIVKQGNDRYGREEMTDIGDRIAGALGDKTAGVMGVLRDFDDPVSILEGLNRKSDVELKRFAQMSLTRQATECAKLQARANPNDDVHVSDNPRWRDAPTAKMTKEAFGTAISDAIDDKAWSKAFDKFSRFGRGRR